MNTLWIELVKKIVEFKLNYFIRSSKSHFDINKMVIIYYVYIYYMKTMNLILFISINEIHFEKN
jgi:hypothetical protein